MGSRGRDIAGRAGGGEARKRRASSRLAAIAVDLREGAQETWRARAGDMEMACAGDGGLGRPHGRSEHARGRGEE
jgi:hypothetical protein